MVNLRVVAQLSLGVGLCLAQTSVVSILIPPVPRVNIGASVVSADATATEYVLGCVPDKEVPEGGCLLEYGATVKVEKTAFTLHATTSYTVTASALKGPSTDSEVDFAI